MPGKQLTIEAKATKPGTHRTDYESQRKDKIAANKRVMEELGLQQDKQALSSACQKPKRPPATPRARQMLDLTPKRISERAAGKPKVEYSLDKLFGEMEGEHERKRQRTGGGGGRARAANGESAYQGERNLPDSYDRHNRSCHICTQGVCSWRGAFRLPLKCSKCRTIWCDRCLRNIFGDTLPAKIALENVDDWKCLMCQDACACQHPNMKQLDRNLDRHKAWNWVGAAGGGGSVNGGSSLAVHTHDWNAPLVKASEFEFELAAEDTTEYEVEAVVGHRMRGRKQKVREYKVRWKGFGPDEDTWQTLEALGEAEDLVMHYEATVAPVS